MTVSEEIASNEKLNKHVKQQGFTLIEILIALFISSLIFTMLTFGLKTLINNYQRLEKTGFYFSRLQLGVYTLSQDLNNIMPRKIRDEKNQLLPAFRGGENFIEMTTARNMLIRCLYFTDQGKLIRRTFSILDRVKPYQYKDSILFNGVIDFKLNYINAQKNTVKQWPEIQNDNITLPLETPNSSALTSALASSPEIYPMVVIMTLHLKNYGSITRFFLVKKAL